MNPFADLTNRDSDTVQTALTRRCGVCKAPKNSDCKGLNGRKLNRIVHLERAQQHLDRRKK